MPYREEPTKKNPAAVESEAKYIEVEVNLSTINNKINYLISLLEKKN